MLGVKRRRQSFTFEYKLKVVARADNFVSSRISFVFGCGLSASAGNLLKFFSCYCKKWPMRVIARKLRYTNKLLNSDWLGAVQFRCNNSAKSVIPVQITHQNFGL